MIPQDVAPTLSVLVEVRGERERQDTKWGAQNVPDGTGTSIQKAMSVNAKIECDQAMSLKSHTWAHILREEVAEALAESDRAALRTELIQVAAVAVAWIECLDRNAPRPGDDTPPTMRSPT